MKEFVSSPRVVFSSFGLILLVVGLCSLVLPSVPWAIAFAAALTGAGLFGASQQSSETPEPLPRAIRITLLIATVVLGAIGVWFLVK